MRTRITGMWPYCFDGPDEARMNMERRLREIGEFMGLDAAEFHEYSFDDHGRLKPIRETCEEYVFIKDNKRLRFILKNDKHIGPVLVVELE